jgi:hypothetical protein
MIYGAGPWMSNIAGLVVWNLTKPPTTSAKYYCITENITKTI